MFEKIANWYRLVSRGLIEWQEPRKEVSVKEVWRMIVIYSDGQSKVYLLDSEEEARAFAEYVAKVAETIVLQHWSGTVETIL